VVLSVSLAASTLAGAREGLAQEQTFDHLTCVRVNRDERLAPMPPPLALTSEQTEFLSSNGCKPVGGGRIARADEVCYPSAKAPGNPPNGADLSGQSFLCYRVKCARNDGGRTEFTVTDQFGTGTIFANERPVTKKLCVPAFVGTVPTPTPSVTPTGTPSVTPTPTAAPTQTPVPTATVSPTGTPAPTATATTTPEPTPTATPVVTATPTSTPVPTETATPPTPTPGGSASLAFVERVADLLH